jgi:hypothetical protein
MGHEKAGHNAGNITPEAVMALFDEDRADSDEARNLTASLSTPEELWVLAHISLEIDAGACEFVIN